MFSKDNHFVDYMGESNVDLACGTGRLAIVGSHWIIPSFPAPFEAQLPVFFFAGAMRISTVRMMSCELSADEDPTNVTRKVDRLL